MLRGSKHTAVFIDEAVYVDEEAEIHEKNFCRNCHVWKLIHFKKGNSVRYTPSCEEFIPSDNLEYLEYLYARRTNENI